VEAAAGQAAGAAAPGHAVHEVLAVDGEEAGGDGEGVGPELEMEGKGGVWDGFGERGGAESEEDGDAVIAVEEGQVRVNQRALGQDAGARSPRA
jgi:hypothetical protein